MELLKIGVGEEIYDVKEDQNDQLKAELKKNKEADSPLQKFLTALALCHTVVTQPASEADETEHDPQKEPEKSEHHFIHLPHILHHKQEQKHEQKKPEKKHHSHHTAHEIHHDGEEGIFNLCCRQI